MSIEVIRGLIADFGLSVTISAIFIFVAYKFIKNTMDQNNRLMKLLLDERKNEHTANRIRHNELIDKRLEINSKIKNAIEAFRQKVDADRVYIFEYHNGESNLNGLPFAKVSATYEILKPGVSSYKSRLQGIPSGLILEFNQNLLTNKQISVPNISDYKDIDPVGNSVLIRPDVKSFYVALINNINGYPIGFIGMDYICRESGKEEADKAIKELKAISLQIGSLLEVDDIEFN